MQQVTPHADRAHAQLAPSSAHRWMRCPGSVALTDGLPESTSTFASEGTAAHILAERCVSSGVDALHYRGWTIETAKSHGTGGNDPFYRPDDSRGKADGITRFEVTMEMVDGVQMFVDVCNEIAEQSDEFEVEQRLDVSKLIAGVFGTGDGIAYRSAPTRRVTIADLKYGKGVSVDVVENEQELTYALGVAARYHNHGVDEVELIIVQPRAPHRDGPVRRWVTDLVGLYEFGMEAQDAAARAAESDAPLLPGDWCKFCKAAGICPALRERVYSAIGATRDVMGNLMTNDPAKYSPEELAQALKDLPLIITYRHGVEQFAHAEALRGKLPPGWKLVPQRATRKWKDKDAAAETLDAMGFAADDIYDPATIKSPAQIEPLMPGKNAKLRAAALAPLVDKESKGTSLAPIEDPRDAVEPAGAQGFEAFDMVKGLTSADVIGG